MMVLTASPQMGSSPLSASELDMSQPHQVMIQPSTLGSSLLTSQNLGYPQVCRCYAEKIINK